MICIAISCGDPAGIGAEIIAKSIARYRPKDVLFKLYGAVLPFEKLAEKFRWAKEFMKGVSSGEVRFYETGKCNDFQWGKSTANCGDVAFEALLATAESAKKCDAQAIVTAPISKNAIMLAGHNYAGHTEILAEIFNVDVTMMLFAGKFRVSLATRHISLREVADAISENTICGHIFRTNDALRKWFCVQSPRIGVLSLNPHGGENGKIGTEEREIESAINIAQHKGINVIGPLVPDVAFLPKVRRSVDAYIAMYHDQGLIPLKMVGFRRGVNITLGLPIPRTSPDHGTAFDIAGRGIASPLSFINALRTAVKIARKIHKTHP